MRKLSRIVLGISAIALGSAGAVGAQTPAATGPDTSPNEASQPLVKQAPKGAPNIVLVLLDDVGFGAASTFGGLAQTPNLDRLAHEGLRYNRFHTAGICSPTRAALLTGRNPHVTGIGSVENSVDARPGYTGFHGKDTATIARILADNGYATAAFGKWHQTADWELSQSGPFDRWPTGEGFGTFYGFQGGETDQFDPTLYSGTTPVMRPPGDHYHLTEDLAKHAIHWMRNEQVSTPNRPFFLYFATGGIHAPIQVPREWIDKYRGKFDMGWDKLRDETFQREKKLGVIPANTLDTPRPKELPAWDTLSPDQQKFASKLMEAYAAYLAHTDAQVGKLVDELKREGQFDNTLFIYIVGDNGASAEGTIPGSIDYMGALTGITPPPGPKEFAREDEIGGPHTYSHINSAWAWAVDAPFQWTKAVASHLGATRNPMVITWPDKIKDAGGLRSQFSDVNDIVPTILDITGIKAPASVDDVPQKKMNGVSLTYTFDNPKAPGRHNTQYFETFGNRSIYHDGWMASAFHGRYPWQAFALDHPMDQDKWELYDLDTDFSQAIDLAKKYPKKLEEMKAIFMQQAAENRVLPLRGQVLSRKGIPDLSLGREEADYHEGDIGIPEGAIPHLAGRSFTIQASVDAGDHPRGVIAALGGVDAGMSLFIDGEGRPAYTYRLYDMKVVRLLGSQPLSPGKHVLKVDFDSSGKGITSGGTLHFAVDGQEVGTDTLPKTPIMFSIHETFGVGIDTGAPAGDYPQGSLPGYAISGAKIEDVNIRLR